MEQRLGRDAAPVGTGTTEQVAIDDRDAGAPGARLVRSRLPTRAGTDDDEVELVHVAGLPWDARRACYRGRVTCR